MTSETVFVRHVKDALANLYDPVHLQVHPLTELLPLERLPHESAGEALRKRLWQTIESLQPQASLPPHRPEWLSYRLLWLYYVQLFEPHAVQHELSLAERTFYRRLQEAVEAVASILWQEHRTHVAGAGTAGAATAGAQVNDTNEAARHARETAIRLIQSGHREMVSLREALSGAVDTILPLAQQRRIALDVHATADLPDICGDPAVLHQVLVNVLLGGLELVGASALRLGVAVENGRTLWRLGPLKAALDQATAHHAVVLSRELIAACGGDLAVRRVPDGGAEIGLVIPCKPLCTVLVVDDDADARELLARLLSAQGYAVEATHSAHEVAEILARSRPDAILLDVLMPQQDGWKLLQQIKTAEETADIPVIICSVLSQPGLAMSLGAAAVLNKPISEEALAQTLRRVLVPAGSEASPL
jgi:CheY-like chemotaxis protein